LLFPRVLLRSELKTCTQIVLEGIRTGNHYFAT
jgi:hypothetical protein